MIMMMTIKIIVTITIITTIINITSSNIPLFWLTVFTCKKPTCLSLQYPRYFPAAILKLLLRTHDRFDCKKQTYSDWVCTAVMSNDVMKDLRG